VLKQRIATALVLVPVVAVMVLWLPTQALAGVLAVPALIGAWEWTAFMRLDAAGARLAFCAVLLALLGTAALLACVFEIWVVGVLEAALAWWLASALWLIKLRCSPPWALQGVAGVLTLAPAWLALVALHAERPAGPGLLLFLFALVWAADIGAYFFGRYFGRRRLAPAISPGKTWEGVIGGELAAVVLAVAGAFWFNQPLLGFVPLCALVVAFSVVGDLSESLFKRQVGLKDSGAIFPGHGGLLDRIDSLTAAAPTFVLGLMALERLR
jgi:phosphatidate cytidylyltransferase